MIVSPLRSGRARFARVSTVPSLQGRVALGPRARQVLRRLRSADSAQTTAPRCARLEGFSLHADVAAPARRRDQQERVCLYLLRPPLALERLTESSGGQLLSQFRRPWRDGSTALLLDPVELLEEIGHRAEAVAGRRAGGGGARPTPLAVGPAPAPGLRDRGPGVSPLRRPASDRGRGDRAPCGATAPRGTRARRRAAVAPFCRPLADRCQFRRSAPRRPV